MGRAILKLELSEQQRQELSRLVRAPRSSQREVRRARIVLLRAEGKSQEATAQEVGVNRPVVAVWERRFRRNGMAGLIDAKGRGRKGSISPQTIERVLTEAVQPPAGRTRWSVRAMACHVQVSPATVQRLWSANDIKPHLVHTFKLSRDQHFEAKFWDVIGLYLNPPDRALVLCCDEKSQCQALQRTQPGLPLGIGHIRTRTHDYVRHGTITLFAALSYLDGKIISRIAPRHDNVEWLAFLKKIDRETPADLDLHLIADNYGTHKHPNVERWLAKHPRFHMHFVPTSSSWLNLVERFFRDVSEDTIREGSFNNIRELTQAIETYLAERNLDPKPYRWRAKGADILAKIRRAREMMAKQSVNA
ncbi:MAG: IS630 family transposase [Gammaproteobacteria bacterium]